MLSSIYEEAFLRGEYNITYPWHLLHDWMNLFLMNRKCLLFLCPVEMIISVAMKPLLRPISDKLVSCNSTFSPWGCYDYWKLFSLLLQFRMSLNVGLHSYASRQAIYFTTLRYSAASVLFSVLILTDQQDNLNWQGLSNWKVDTEVFFSTET